MATRISFSTTYPDRMGLLKGKFTRFPEKILKGIYDGKTYYMSECPKCGWIGSSYFALGGGQIADTGDYSDLGCPKCFTTLEDSDYDFGYYGQSNLHPKTTTIRKNYDYWKSKEGQMIQPFFWAGKPYRSKQVVFCPELRLARVQRIEIDKGMGMITIESDERFLFIDDGRQLDHFTQNEGFDDPDQFWMWFDRDFSGAYLELESVEE